MAVVFHHILRDHFRIRSHHILWSCSLSGSKLPSLVLFSSGCHNKCNRLGGLKDRRLFLTILQAQGLRSRPQQAQFLHERHSVSHITAYIGIDPITRTPSSQSNHLYKVPPPYTITLGVRAAIYEFERGTDIESRASHHLVLPFGPWQHSPH